MKSFDYYPLAETVTLHFVCPECGEEIDTDALGVPSANYMAEKAGESENSEEYEIYCSHCDWSSMVSLYTRIDGGYGEVEELDSESPLKVDIEMPKE